MKKISFSTITLLVALTLSSVAAYYSIIGLTAIFSGAVIPIIIMGMILEIGKITTTVWLRKYWHKANFLLKLYLVPAAMLLAFLTSVGCFGFLSKAHSEQNLISGQVLSKLEIYDQKIQVAKENIQTLRQEMKQLDMAVDQIMVRSTTEQGADKANAVRKSQQKDRVRINKEIEVNQKLISSLNNESAPIRAEIKKIEAEVGPIKYIAAFLYGNDINSSKLESAVRWMIVLLVVVFDPLAIALVIAANASKEWDKEESDKPDAWVADVGEKPTVEELKEEPEESDKPDAWVADVGEKPTVEELKEDFKSPVKEDEFDISKHPYLFNTGGGFKNLTPMVAIDKTLNNVIPEEELTWTSILNTTKLEEVPGDYVIFDGKMISKSALKEIKPELFAAPSNDIHVTSKFGIKFPQYAKKDDVFVRVDVSPNRAFKFDGLRWIEINNESSEQYSHDIEYLQYLISKIDSGEYDVNLLSDKEKDQIKSYLNSEKVNQY